MQDTHINCTCNEKFYKVSVAFATKILSKKFLGINGWHSLSIKQQWKWQQILDPQFYKFSHCKSSSLLGRTNLRNKFFPKLFWSHDALFPFFPKIQSTIWWKDIFSSPTFPFFWANDMNWGRDLMWEHNSKLMPCVVYILLHFVENCNHIQSSILGLNKLKVGSYLCFYML